MVYLINFGDELYKKLKYTIPPMIHLWSQSIVSGRSFEMLRLTPDFERLRLTCDFNTLRLTPAHQNIVSDARQTQARRNVSKSCVRSYFL